MVAPVQEGFVPFRGHQTFYKVVGDLTQRAEAQRSEEVLPLLAVHGRPISHEALTPLARIAESGRPVIFYDQIGCGQSDRPDDPAMWSIELFVDELDAVRRHLNLEHIHILGHSWGGMVAMAYALRQPDGIASMILHSASATLATRDAYRKQLRGELPSDVQEAFRKHEADGTTSDPAYRQAEQLFALRHVCRVDPWPDYLIESLKRQPVGKVSLEDWDIRSRLGEINIPTLVTCGRYDFVAPAEAMLISNGIPGSELAIFEESSHYAHIEETDRYLALINDFMVRVERG